MTRATEHPVCPASSPQCGEQHPNTTNQREDGGRDGLFTLSFVCVGHVFHVGLISLLLFQSFRFRFSDAGWTVIGGPRSARCPKLPNVREVFSWVFVVFIPWPENSQPTMASTAASHPTQPRPPDKGLTRSGRWHRGAEWKKPFTKWSMHDIFVFGKATTDTIRSMAYGSRDKPARYKRKIAIKIRQFCQLHEPAQAHCIYAMALSFRWPLLRTFNCAHCRAMNHQ